MAVEVRRCFLVKGSEAVGSGSGLSDGLDDTVNEGVLWYSLHGTEDL